ncbi:hypothetical protein P9E76_07360 [Schinkia azotoformans]|uniref:NLPA lipoprotein n=1 Tax=Schinkia azotoformans LMG 9581 TaxID=1131731 RepID=K6D8A6_SCHAZ|nr:hypothetical protein [Schinkia azotoformans]EKN64328.1 NLPA lipoprotein [Schinkia azotoformans LMG 9581]MEC1637963.1 hypothetical protein [Schinkia azotoformans]MEC1944860.1 hypothetical protein [Schinkia azotoformans]
MKVEKDVIDLSFKWIKYDNLKIQEEDYKELTNSLVEMGLQENPPTFADFVDNSLIDKAK